MACLAPSTRPGPRVQGLRCPAGRGSARGSRRTVCAPSAGFKFYQGDPSDHYDDQRERAFRRSRESSTRARGARLALKQLYAASGGEVAAAEELNKGAPVTHTPEGFAWGTYVSRRKDLDLAIIDCVSRIRKAYNAMQPDLAIVYVSSHFKPKYDCVIPMLRKQLPSLKCIIGCTGYGVIGSTVSGPKEIEGDDSAFSLTLGMLPDVDIGVKYVTTDDLPDGDAPPAQWEDLMGSPAHATDASTNFIVLSDPRFQGLPNMLEGLDYSYPSAAKVGGLASAGGRGDHGGVWAWDASEESAESAGASDGLRSRGAAVLVLHGNCTVDTMVAQGCRPLSDTVWTVTQVVKGNIITALSDANGETFSPMRALQQELAGVPSEAAREHAARNITIGVDMDPFNTDSAAEAHDFLIRVIMGADPNSGAIAVGEALKPGQSLRWMVRDADGARSDLVAHGTAWKQQELSAVLTGKPSPPLLGALVFSCNGRGSALYGECDYDARTISQFAPVPLAGFQGNGEIGPVGGPGTTRLHGFTASVGLVRAGRRTNEDAAEAGPEDESANNE